jgi:hypothetical protein
MQLKQRRYERALRDILAPGYGCHPTLLGAANLGVMAGVDPERIHNDIRRSIPNGNRDVPDREISDTIKKALQDHSGGTFSPKPRPKAAVKDGKKSLQEIITQAKIETEVDLWESSPIRLMDDLRHDTILFLKTLYVPTDLLWIGERVQPGIIGDTIRPISDWITHFKNGGKTAPHIILNPLTGQPAPTKGGDKETLRGDGNVAAYRYCMAEFDTLSRIEQIKFWAAVKLPIIALIDSGNKSIHGIIEISKLANVPTSAQWDSEIKGRLYDRILKPLGVDSACSNPARLSRLPGHYRTEKDAIQKLLWLSPEGRPVGC